MRSFRIRVTRKPIVLNDFVHRLPSVNRKALHSHTLHDLPKSTFISWVRKHENLRFSRLSHQATYRSLCKNPMCVKRAFGHEAGLLGAFGKDERLSAGLRFLNKCR
jgi:hypothetical protein